MPILSEEDIAIYAPSVTLTGAALTAQIAFIQLIMESDQGANRPLELTEFVEIIPVKKKVQTAYPRHFPIATDPALTVEVRVANQLNEFHRASGAEDWHLLDDSAFKLNENGRIDLNFMDQAFKGSQYFDLSNNEARLTYTSGFDFTESSPDVVGIKAIAGQMLSYQQSANYSGIRRQKVDKEYEMEWFQSGGGFGKFPDNLLMPLKKYRPRIFF